MNTPLKDRPLSVGIIGVGNIVQTMHLPILYSLPEFSVRYLADLELKNGLEAPFNAERIDLDSKTIPVLPSTDVVFLATPPGVRDRYFELFAARDEWIFCEKPFAISLAEHHSAIALCKRVSCNYNRQDFANIRQLEGILKGRIFGELKEIQIQEAASPRGTGKAPGHYQFNRQLGGGGILIERGCHTLSQLDRLFAEQKIELTASQVKEIDGIDIDVSLAFEIEKARGTPVPLRFTLSTGRVMETFSKYSFETADVLFDHTDPESKLMLKGLDGTSYTVELDLPGSRTATQSFIQSWQRFALLARGRRIENPNLTTSLRTTEWIERAYRKGLNK